MDDKVSFTNDFLPSLISPRFKQPSRYTVIISTNRNSSSANPMTIESACRILCRLLHAIYLNDSHRGVKRTQVVKWLSLKAVPSLWISVSFAIWAWSDNLGRGCRYSGRNGRYTPTCSGTKDVLIEANISAMHHCRRRVSYGSRITNGG